MIGSLKKKKEKNELKNIRDDHHTSIRSLAVLRSVLYKPLQLGRRCLEDGEPIYGVPYGVLRTEHMVPDPKHQPPHLWGSTTPIYLSRYGVLGTLCTPYSLHCMYLQQLRTEKVVICPRCPYLPRFANLFVHSACIKQGPDGGCPHSI